MRRTPSNRANGAAPGTPKRSVGIKEPDSIPLLAADGAITPRGSPLPNLLVVGFRAANAWACPYANHEPAVAPTPGKKPTPTPTAEPRITSVQCLTTSRMPWLQPPPRSMPPLATLVFFAVKSLLSATPTTPTAAATNHI